MKKAKELFWLSAALLAAFLLWTALLRLCDVQPIGPAGSFVGLARINQAFHNFTGVHFGLYHVTDWLGLVPVGLCAGFAVMGLVQWIRRKHICRVDFNILALGGFYLAVMAVYLLFESVVINHRPVLINGFLETSYPSSTTLLVMCVMPTAMMQFQRYINVPPVRKIVLFFTAAFTVFMVLGRLLCGVHWLSDIVGGGLLSGWLVTMYYSVLLISDNKKRPSNF